MESTSLQAYSDLIRSGRMSKLQLLAWVILQQHGPMTGRELSKKAGVRDLWKRLSELRKLGLVAVSEQPRTCKESGKSAFTWQIISASPEAAAAAPKERRTRDRRRWWIVVPPASSLDPGNSMVRGYIYASAADAEQSAQAFNGELIEVREVMRSQ